MQTTISNAPSQAESPYPRLHRLRFRFQAREPIRLPAYTGSAWRGLLGHALRQTACVTRQPSCGGCLLIHNCVYSGFFETPPASAEAAARYTALPHPFVLEPELDTRRVVETGEPLRLGLTLIGPAINAIPYLIHAFQRAGERGFGRDGGRFALRNLSQETAPGSDNWGIIYDAADGKLRALDAQPDIQHSNPSPATIPPQPITLHLQTPLRIKHHGRFIGPGHLTAADLLRALISRVDTLRDLYGPADASSNTGTLYDALPDVQISQAELRWHEWTRYSSRQQTSLQMGGLVGRLQLTGDGLHPLLPLLHFGQWTHIGKGTSLGLGRYRLASPIHDCKTI